MMQFRSVDEFLALTGDDAPTSAEKALIEACRAGNACILSDTRPTAPSDTNRVRASLLRLLITGGTPECGLHVRGVTAAGAWVTGELDLSYCTARGRTGLRQSHFVEEPNLDSAKLTLLSLDSSHLPGLFAQRIAVVGSAFLRDLTATGTVDVSGAKIGGQLDCTGATLNGVGGRALNAQSVETGESLFLRDVTATGTVDVSGAKIGGQLSCTGATLNGAGGEALNAQGVETGRDLFLSDLTATGTVDLGGAKIGRQLDCTGATLDGAGGKALNGQRMIVSASFFFRGLKSVIGRIDVTAAHVGDLVDDLASWPRGVDDLILDGFTYDRIIGGAPVTLAARRDWLAMGSSWRGDFRPQPYTHFARTLRAMGHPVEARRVMIEANVQRALRDRAVLRAKRGLQRKIGLLSRSLTEENYQAFVEAGNTMPAPAREWAGKVLTRYNAIHRKPADHPKAPPPLPQMTMVLARQGFQNDMAQGALWCQVRRVGNKLWNSFLHKTVGYGYAPQNSIFTLSGLILAATLLAQVAWDEGSFAPNSDVILTSPQWTGMTDKGCVVAPTPDCLTNPAAEWSAKNAPGMDWDSFNAAAYAADLVVPLIDLGQTQAWAPSKDRGWMGWLMWWGRWFFIIAGWVVASLGLAAVTGFVQKNAPD